MFQCAKTTTGVGHRFLNTGGTPLTCAGPYPALSAGSLRLTQQNTTATAGVYLLSACTECGLSGGTDSDTVTAGPTGQTRFLVQLTGATTKVAPRRSTGNPIETFTDINPVITT
jgi:hypothetical protein